MATRAWTTSAVPLWISEGAADYAGYLGSSITTDRRFQELANAVSQNGWQPRDLPGTEDFAGLATRCRGRTRSVISPAR